MRTASIIQQVEAALVARLTEAFTTPGKPHPIVDVLAWPSDPRAFKMQHPVGACLVIYRGRADDDRSAMAGQRVEQEASYEIGILARTLREHQPPQGTELANGVGTGAYDLLDICRQALMGWRMPVACGVTKVKKDAFDDYVEGVWAKIRFPDIDDLLTQWLPVMHSKTQDDKQFWTLDVGEQVKCLMDDRLEDGCILGAIYSEVDIPPTDDVDEYGVTFKDGGWFSYNRRTGLFTALIMGDAVVEVGGKMRATVAGNTTLDVGGNLSATVAGTTRVESGGNATFKAPKVILDTPEVHCLQALKVTGAITAQSTLAVAGAVTTDATITSVGKVTAQGVVLS